MAAKKQTKLTALEIQAIKEPGRYRVDKCLYLQIDKRNYSKSWVYRYRDRVSGKLKSKGVGGYPTLSLAEARKRALNYQMMLHNGVDPVQSAREERKAKERTDNIVTFGDCARAYIEAHKAGWRNIKHHAQWGNTLSTYAEPLMKLPVTKVTKAEILACLTRDDFWNTKNETASRVRQRIEAVMDYAKARDLYVGENPAIWRGNLKELLPAPGKIKKPKNHPALPYNQINRFMGELKKKGIFSPEGSLSSKSLALVILTACRISEVVGAKWNEFDLISRTWTIPGERMKAGRPHTVPLCQKAIEILNTLKPRKNGFVFPGEGNRNNKPNHLSDAAPRKLCNEIIDKKTGLGFKDMYGNDITVHGFRSTFRDWAADMTTQPREVAEACLAHILSDKTEAAYRRSDLLNKRASLMQEWELFCFKD